MVKFLQSKIPFYRWFVPAWVVLVLAIFASVGTAVAMVQFGNPDPGVEKTPVPTITPTPAPTATPAITPTPTPEPEATPTQPPGTNQPPVEPVFKSFSPSGFIDLYYSLTLPGTYTQTNPPPIYGQAEADAQIQSLAQQAGYRLQPVANGTLVSIQGQSMFASTRDAWLAMQQAAKVEGITLGLISGFRSVDTQRSLFIGSMKDEGLKRVGREYTMAEIAAGAADAAIQEILTYRSIPGCSKHHTGYTIDITDSGSGLHFTSFRQTAGYLWISANNFANAKRFGFIPSYPEGATNMGPNPEAWEYVYIGQQPLMN